MIFKRSTCLKGLHAMVPENTYVIPKTGQRYCKECLKLRRNSKNKPIKPAAGTINLILPADTWRDFQLAAAYQDKDATEVYLGFIRDYIDKHGMKNLQPIGDNVSI